MADYLSKTNPTDAHTVKRAVSWKIINEQVNEIAKKIDKKGWDIKQIFGVPRGGLVAAVMLSHKLKAAMIFDDTLIDNTTLIVDDAIEEGKTIKDLLANNPKVSILYISKDAEKDEILSKYPDLIVGEVKEAHHWIIFPWEEEQ